MISNGRIRIKTKGETRMTYEQLIAKADTIEGWKLRSAVIDAVLSAEQNANETIYESPDRTLDDWQWLFWGSIACTSAFLDNKAVQAWFENIGYTW
jgi:hypothetical protein